MRVIRLDDSTFDVLNCWRCGSFVDDLYNDDRISICTRNEHQSTAYANIESECLAGGADSAAVWYNTRDVGNTYELQSSLEISWLPFVKEIDVKAVQDLDELAIDIL